MERYPENPGEVLYKNNLLEKIDLDRQWKFNFQLKERFVTAFLHFSEMRLSDWSKKL